MTRDFPAHSPTHGCSALFSILAPFPCCFQLLTVLCSHPEAAWSGGAGIWEVWGSNPRSAWSWAQLHQFTSVGLSFPTCEMRIMLHCPAAQDALDDFAK